MASSTILRSVQASEAELITRMGLCPLFAERDGMTQWYIDILE